MKAIYLGSFNQESFNGMKKLVTMGVNVDYFVTDEIPPNYDEEWCANHNVKCVNSLSLISLNEKFDLLVSFSYKYKIPVEWINNVSIPINFHPAPLPMYRGRALATHAILNGETKWGVTCQYVAPEFDKGEIIDIKWFEIPDNMKTCYKLSNYSWKKCTELLEEIVTKILNDVELTSYNPNIAGNYYSMNTLNNCKKIELTDTAELIDRKINALWCPPYEGAYIEIDKEKFFLVNHKILKEINELYLKDS